MAEKTVSELARETLMQLIKRKLTPTPANYSSVFNELGGLPNNPPFPLEELRRIAKSLPTWSPGQQKQRALLEYAVSQLNWKGVQDALMAYGQLTPRSNGPETSGVGALDATDAATPVKSGSSSATPAGAPTLTGEFLEQIARLIEFVRPALGTDDARFSEQTDDMLKVMRKPGVDVMLLKQMLGSFGHRVSFATEEQVEIKRILLLLVQLIFENIGKLSQDDHWLMGQIDALKLAATPPITLRRLDEVERKLRDVIVKQSDAKGLAQEAQEEMRQMLRVFVERLSDMSSSSGSYGMQMEKNAVCRSQVSVSVRPARRSESGTTRDSGHHSRYVQKFHHFWLPRLHPFLASMGLPVGSSCIELSFRPGLAGAPHGRGVDETFDRLVGWQTALHGLRY